jgi:hypothetical protein
MGSCPGPFVTRKKEKDKKKRTLQILDGLELEDRRVTDVDVTFTSQVCSVFNAQSYNTVY